MKYKIKQHIRFRLKRPVKRIDKNSIFKNVGEEVTKNKAYGRMDRKDNLSVNVLIMAKDKKKNSKESRITAGDLFGKLGRRENVNNKQNDNEFVKDSNSIDVTDEAYDSDSDLDINELLKKYIPDYDSENDKNSDENTEMPKKSGVLSMLKKTEANVIAEDENEKDENDHLIDSLDTAFGLPEKSNENKEKKSDSDSLISEYEIESEDDEQNELDNAFVEEYDDILPEENEIELEEEPVKTKKKAKFSFFNRKSKAADVDSVIDENPEDALETDDNPETADAEITNQAEPAPETSAEPEPETASDEIFSEDTAEAAESGEKSDESESVEGKNELEASEEDEDSDVNLNSDEFDPTDINLMVAFGLDAGENKKAKEFGDKLEAKQHDREARKIKLDRPEFVDKTQAADIKKEFHDKKVKLWIKLALCAVFTILLMIFENIPALTKIFTGTEKQFAGAFDPAVYPTVYIMISLQLMLLACFCAVDEIVNGFKYLFRGIPRPESMTALLTVAGILYSAILSLNIVSPNEPVMFNFVTALSALLTLVYAIYNNNREAMNFSIISNKKPKHIVRRLPDEESEGESRAFAEHDDVCDVMKIEKTDFIDGFFGRLSKPDSTTGIFMTFAMSISVAAAVLFGILVNFKGGDNAMICRVIYSSLLVLAPMSAYVTFSYPFYRANIAAKEYDSAIIGETSLEEYSNASIISFDDKNVFPSYSVKVQNIKIYNNARIDRMLYYASSVFAYAGGPLQDVFEVATKDMGISKNVKIFDTEAGFLATQVDGVNIIFGSSDTLQKRGLEIPENALKDDVDLSDELSIMYMFRENKLVAKMYIKYVMDSDIDLILKQFSGNGLYVCVRTFDPNINEKMIAKKAGMKKMPLKIVRYASADEVGNYEEKVDSGLVTCGSPKSLLQIISYCGKVLHTKKTDIALGVLSVMIGIAILVLLMLADSLTVLTSLLIVIYQLIWLIPITIASKVFIR